MPKICIDAGHYGDYNRSPADGRYYEARAMWELHKLLMRELRARGFETEYSRQVEERDMLLEARGRQSKNCDLFISLHSNAVASGVREDIDYPVAYVSVDGGADEIGLRLAQCVEQVMGTKQAARIEKKLNSKGNADYYGVLRGAASVGVPGVILEHSFHTNTAATRWLLERGNLEKLAVAEAEALAKYFGMGNGEGAADGEIPMLSHRPLLSTSPCGSAQNDSTKLETKDGGTVIGKSEEVRGEVSPGATELTVDTSSDSLCSPPSPQGEGKTGDGGTKTQSAEVPAPDNPSAPSGHLPLHKGGIQGSRDGEGETETGDEIVIKYKYLSDIPDNWDKDKNPRALIKGLMDKGILTGSGEDEKGVVLDLSHDLLRTLVILNRAGVLKK